MHGHWTQNGIKMSKTKGNVISPFSEMESFHADVLRYYMIKEGGQEKDGDWSSESLRNRYIYLSNTWGNLVQRMISPKMDLKVALDTVFYRPETLDGKPYIGPKIFRGLNSPFPNVDEELEKIVRAAITQYRLSMKKLDLKAALDSIDGIWKIVTFQI